MVNLKSSRHVKIRRITAIVTLVFAIAFTAFVAIAFLGRAPGSFNINLHEQNVALSLDTNKDFQHKTTFINVPESPQFDVTSEAFVNDYKGEIDDPATNGKYYGASGVNEKTGIPSRIKFFKFTYYIKNVGTANAIYDLNVNIVDNVKPVNSQYGYDEMVRIRLYCNDVDSSNHDYETYAKPKPGEERLPEFVSDETSGLAINFINETLVCKPSFEIGIDAIHRVTIVVWLEGYDGQTSGQAPTGGTLKLGMDIHARKN